MAVSVDSARLPQIAYNHGYNGRALPAGMAEHAGAHQLGRDDAAGGRPRRDTADIPAPAPAPARPRARAGAGSGRDRATSPATVSGGRRAARTPRPAPRRKRGRGRSGSHLPRSVARVVPGGDAGGLMLALVLYPIALSVIQYGAAGPGMWFKAKFLNKTPAGTTPDVPDTTPPGTPNSGHAPSYTNPGKGGVDGSVTPWGTPWNGDPNVPHSA